MSSSGKNLGLGCGVVGIGHWGNIICSKISSSPNAELIATSRKRLDQGGFKNIPCLKLEELLQHNSIDLVWIATPTKSHFEIAKMCLQMNKNVIIEKPFCSNIEQAKELLQLAIKNNVRLFCNHIFLYSPIFKALKCNKEITETNVIESRRSNWGVHAPDDTLLEHLGYHDIYIWLDLFQLTQIDNVKSVELSINKKQLGKDYGSYHLTDNNERNYFLTLSVCSPPKIRVAKFISDKKVLEWDDTNKSPLRQYEIEHNKKSYNNKESLLSIDQDQGDALDGVVNELVKVIGSDKESCLDGLNALKVKKVLKHIQESWVNNANN